MPEDENVAKKDVAKPSIGDGGLKWWTKALERCHELAKIDGKSVEEIAAERYGSLEALMEKIDNAKGASNNRFVRPGQYYDKYKRNDNYSNKKTNWRRNDEEIDRKKKKDRSKSPASKSSSSEDDERKNKKQKKSKRTDEVIISKKVEKTVEIPLKNTNVDASLSSLGINELGAKLIKAELMGDEVFMSDSFYMNVSG
jgi:hypothetical protein